MNLFLIVSKSSTPTVEWSREMRYERDISTKGTRFQYKSSGELRKGRNKCVSRKNGVDAIHAYACASGRQLRNEEGI